MRLTATDVSTLTMPVSTSIVKKLAVDSAQSSGNYAEKLQAVYDVIYAGPSDSIDAVMGRLFAEKVALVTSLGPITFMYELREWFLRYEFKPSQVKITTTSSEISMSTYDNLTLMKESIIHTCDEINSTTSVMPATIAYLANVVYMLCVGSYDDVRDYVHKIPLNTIVKFSRII